MGCRPSTLPRSCAPGPARLMPPAERAASDEPGVVERTAPCFDRAHGSVRRQARGQDRRDAVLFRSGDLPRLSADLVGLRNVRFPAHARGVKPSEYKTFLLEQAERLKTHARQMA